MRFGISIPREFNWSSPCVFESQPDSHKYTALWPLKAHIRSTTRSWGSAQIKHGGMSKAGGFQLNFCLNFVIIGVPWSYLNQECSKRKTVTVVVFGKAEPLPLIWTMYFSWHQTVFLHWHCGIPWWNTATKITCSSMGSYNIFEKAQNNLNNFPVIWPRNSWKSLWQLWDWSVRGRRITPSVFQPCLHSPCHNWSLASHHCSWWDAAVTLGGTSGCWPCSADKVQTNRYRLLAP